VPKSFEVIGIVLYLIVISNTDGSSHGNLGPVAYESIFQDNNETFLRSLLVDRKGSYY